MNRTFLLALTTVVVVCHVPPNAVADEKSRATNSERVPIVLNKPDRLNTPRWPVSFGIPFRLGECRDVGVLSIVDEAGAVVPSQFVKTADGADGSVRWALGDFNADFSKKYFLTVNARAGGDNTAPGKDEIRTDVTGGDRISVETGGARYEFRKDSPGLMTIALDANHDGKFAPDETLVAGDAGGFTVLDSTGAKGLLQCSRLRVELAGKRHTVVALEGDYVDAKGARMAAAVIYFHFYAGYSQVRVSHKFIVTEDSNKVWFKDIGWTLRTSLGEAATATFNNDHENPQAAVSHPIPSGARVTMLQDEFPHFGSTKSHFTITEDGNGTKKEVASGSACGDWADVSSPRWGLAAQAPGFAEQFPKALQASANELTIKLWAAESGKELDYRTPQIIKDYFGNDWIPANDPCTKAANIAQGTSKTHELWLYPHAGPLGKEITAGFGATREEIFASIDPAWISRTEVMGPIHPKDTAHFPEAEAAIDDHFDRGVLAGDKVFPATGYLYWGMYPYSAQPWEVRNGHWYPTIHRLARCLEYNLKRGTWVLYARSGERKYYDYARRYTRLLGNLQFSSWDSISKPKGWMVMGQFHSPIVWGHYGARDKKPAMDSEGACLSFASSEDVIQFVYDYFLTGDYHSRDMALMWKEAMFKEMNSDVDRALGFYPPSAFFRVLGSAYELDHDPRVLDYGSKIMQRLVAADGHDILNPQIDHNYGKEGEVFSGFYYYYTATGDPLVKKALVQLAQFRYRHGQLDYFFSRSSCLLQAFALAYRDTHEPIYAAYLSQVVGNFGRNWQTMEKLGVDFASLNPQTTKPWGQLILTHQGTLNTGVPAAEQIISEYQGPRPYLPFAIKPRATQRTHIFLQKERPGPAMLDVFVNNWGDRSIEPKLLDARGQAVPLEIVERDFKHVTKPDCYNDHSIWYLSYEDHIFFRLRIPESVAPGTYQLDLGSEIQFTMLNSDVEKVLQVAPDGLVVLPGHRYYFALPPNVAAVEYFASRPINLFDAAGQPVESESLGKGHYRFQTRGQSGSWALEAGRDQFLGESVEGAESFVRIVTPDFPLTIALGDPGRLFKIDSSAIPHANPILGAESEKAFEDSVQGFGQAIRLNSQFVQVAAGDAAPPQERGTVEFRIRTLWSASDCHLNSVSDSTLRLSFFHADPITATYNIDPDNLGRTGRYNIGQFGLGVQRAGASRAGIFFEAGKWYHIALTWDVNGTDSECNIFINGRKKAYHHYEEGMAKNALVAKLLPPGADIRFGSGHAYGKIPAGEFYDELRVSRTVRYRENFTVPTAPFEPDADTYLLMHFDGTLDGVQNGKPISGKLSRGKM